MGCGKRPQAHEVVQVDISRLQQQIEARKDNTIFYTMTPFMFKLEIPVEALANLSPDAHTRMLRLLGDWIERHKPIVVPTPIPK